MAIQLAARDRSQAGKILGGWLRDVFAGSICGVLSIAFGLSYAVLIFSGPLAPWLSYGVAATFASTAIAALVVALRGSLPFAIAGPDSSTSAVTAVLAAALVERLVAEGGTISVQVLNEIANVARRKMRMSWKETSGFLTMVRGLLPVVSVTVPAV